PDRTVLVDDLRAGAVAHRRDGAVDGVEAVVPPGRIGHGVAARHERGAAPAAAARGVARRARVGGRERAGGGRAGEEAARHVGVAGGAVGGLRRAGRAAAGVAAAAGGEALRPRPARAAERARPVAGTEADLVLAVARVGDARRVRVPLRLRAGGAV